MLLTCDLIYYTIDEDYTEQPSALKIDCDAFDSCVWMYIVCDNA